MRRLVPSLEVLEARTLLAAASLAGGTLTVSDSGSVQDDLQITLSSSLITIVDQTNGMTAGSGGTQVNASTVTFPRSNVTAGMVVNTAGADDRVSLGGSAAGLNVTVNGGSGNDEFIIRAGTVATVQYDGGAGTDSIVNRSGLSTAPTLVNVETNVDRPVLLVPGFGGTQAADLTPAGLEAWLLDRGRHPDDLALEPLSNAYSDIEQTLDNVGYRQGATSFTVKWDWRVPVAVTNDQNNNGVLSDVTLAKLQNEQTSPTWDSGVSYLAWYLGQASNAWQTLTGVLPAEVDLVTHSTGGLLARSFLQSAGYIANDPSLDTLPEINTLIQVGVPAQGSGQTFDLLMNDFGLKPAARILGRALDKAYKLVMEEGQSIQNPDGSLITAALLNAQPDPEAFFIRKYVSTLQDLLSTENFLDDLQNGTPDFRQLTPAQGGNSLLFDLNAGNGLTAFGSLVEEAYIVFSQEADTAQQVTARTGPVLSQGIQNEQVSLSELFGHLPASNEVWYSLSDVPGDGTVAFTSSALPYVGHADFELVNITQAAAGTANPIDHTGLVYNRFSQKQIISRLTGRSVGTISDTEISQDKLLSLPQSVVRLVSLGLVNPLEYAAAGVQKLQGLVDDIRKEMDDALSAELPVIRQSLNDLLNDPLDGLQFNVFSSFATTLQDLASAPDLATLEQRVEQQAGFDPSQFSITFVDGILDLAFDFDVTAAKTVNIDFGASGFGLTGSIPITGSVDLDAAFHLTLDIGGYLAAPGSASGTDFLSITLDEFSIGATLAANNITVGLGVTGLGTVGVQNGNASISGVLGIAFNDVDKTLSVAELLSAGTFGAVVDFNPSIPVSIHLPIGTSTGTTITSIDFEGDLLGADPVLPAVTIDGDYVVNGNESLTYGGSLVFATTSRIIGDNTGGADSFTIDAGGAVTFRGPVGGDGLQNLTVNSGVDIQVAANNTITLPGGNVTFTVTSDAAGEIEILTGAKIITRTTAGSNPVTDESTGNSGNVTFSANEIDIRAGAQILAHVLPTDTESPGHISFTALTETGEAAAALGILLSNRIANVSINGAEIRGGDVSITADASNIQPSDMTADLVQRFIGQLKELLEQLPGVEIPEFNGISASVMRRAAEATISLNSAVIASSGNVTVTANSVVENEIEAIAIGSEKIHLGVAVSFAEAQSTATTNITGTTAITAAGDVLVLSNAEATASANSETESNAEADSDLVDTKSNSIAVAITSTGLDASTTMASGTSITSQDGNVNVRAVGDVVSTPSATATTFSDGLTGITVALGFDTSDVATVVDGSITAKGREAGLVFNPTAGGIVSVSANTIRIPNHGLSNGDVVTYRRNGGTAIGGLEDGEEFHVIVVDADTIQLAKAESLDLDNSDVDPFSTHSLSRFDLKDFSPTAQNVINPQTEVITISGHGFVNGQRVTYSANGNEPVSGLVPGKTYEVDSATTNSFRLRDINSGELVNLGAYIVDPNSDTEQTAHSFLFEQTPKLFVPDSAVDSDADVITLNGHGFATGDAVTYRTDPTRSSSTQQQFGDATVTIGINDPPIRGLRSGDVVYVVVVDANRIRLASTAAEARAAVAVDLTSTGSGTGHVLDAGLTRGIGVSAHLTAENRAVTSSSIGDEPPSESEEAVEENTGGFAALLNFDATSFVEMEEEAEEPDGSDTMDVTSGSDSDALNLAASVGLNFVSHTVSARVGSNAELLSEADVTVEATIEETAQIHVEAGSSKAEDSGGATVATAAGVAVGIYTNDARATVDPGAVIDARDTVTVNAEVTYPFLTPADDTLNPQELFEGNKPSLRDVFEGKLDFSSDIINTWVFTKSDNAEGDVSIAGSVAVTDYNNTAIATIRDGAQINQNTSATYRNAGQTVDVTATTSMQLLGMTGLGEINLTRDGVKNLVKERDKLALVNPFGNSAGKVGIGGAFIVTLIDNNTQAVIEDNARVHSGTSGGLNVAANEDLFAFSFAQSGGEAGTFGLSGSVTVLSMDSITTARLASGVILTGGPVVVDADSNLTHISIAGAVQTGNSVGIGVSIAVNDITRRTQAFIGNDDGTAAGTDGTNINVSSLTVDALADGNLYAFSLAATKLAPEGQDNVDGAAQDTADSTQSATDASTERGGSSSSDQGKQGKFGLGISGAISFNTIDDTSLAFINDAGSITTGAMEVTATNDTDLVAASGSASLVQNEKGAAIAGAWTQANIDGITKAYIVGATLVASVLEVTAKRTGQIIAVAAGGAGAPRKNGVAIAGSVAVSDIDDTTTALVDNSTITLTDSATINASNEADIISVAGALAFGGRGGIGAGVSVNDINTDTVARLEDSTLSYPGSLTVLATNDGQIISIAGSIGASSGTLGIAGTVAVNLITADTEASIVRSQRSVSSPTTTGAVTVQSRSEQYILTVAGAAGVAKTAGLGAAAAYSEIDGTTAATIDQSTFSTTGIVTVSASAEPLIDSITVGVGGGKSFGLGGSATINLVDTTVDARISGGSQITANRVTVSASDGAGNAFDPQTAISGNTLTFGAAHGFATGDDFVYSAKTGEAIGGLDDGGTYYAIVISPTQIRFAESEEDALAGTAITLDKAEASGGQHLIGRSGIRSLAGGLAGSGSAAIGAAVAYNDIDNSFLASIDGSTVTGTSRVDVLSSTNAVIQSLALGGAGAQSFALGGSVSINQITNTIDASVKGGANVSAANVGIAATDAATLQVIAGGLAGSGSAAVGAAVAINEVADTTTASSTASNVTTTSSITIDAASNANILAITLGGSGAGSFALGGSVSLVQLGNVTTAHATGGTLSANAAMRVTAYDDATIVNIAGGLAGSGSAAIGIGSAAITGGSTVDARVGAGTTVSAKGVASGLLVRDGQLNASGVPTTVASRGLAVVAMTTQDILSVAAGGGAAGSVGLAGSASVNVLTNSTKAHIDSGASINPSNSGAATVQDVRVVAADVTNIVGVGGALGGGGSVGAGAGVDVVILTKTTEAFIAPQTTVTSNGNVIIEARSQENITSIAAALGGGGTVGIAGSAGVSVFNITTRAFVGGTGTPAQGAVINAQGNVIIQAIENSDLDVIAGSIAGAGVVSIGAAAAVPVVTKNTEAFIGQNATVNGKGIRGTSNVFTGGFNVGFVADAPSEAMPTSTGGGRVSGTDLELGARGGNRDISQDGGNDLNDQKFTKQRTATPQTTAARGVMVVAVNRDDIETIGASGSGSGTFSADVGGSVNVLNVTTSSHIDSGAKVNHDQASANADQSVLVAAGNDYYHMGIAAALSGSGVATATAGADVNIATFNTSAFIDDGADVRAIRDVSVVANSSEDMLSIAAGAGASGFVSVAGSASVTVLNSTTRAFIGDDAGSIATGAKVTAGGNVLVSARDTTDLDAVSGSAGIGIFAAGAGVSGTVSVLTKNTSAFIGQNATVDANANGAGSLTVFSGSNADASHTTTIKGVAVQAFSSENVLSVAAAAGAGLGAGLAGGIGVQVIDSNTNASVGSSARVNQNNSTASAAQSVNVSAVNEFTSLSFGGAVGGGIVGGGAGIDVGIVKNDTTASINSNALVSAKDDVNVYALADRDVQTYAVSGALGGLAVTGSISVWSFGDQLVSSYSQDGRSENALNVQSGLNPLGKADAFVDGNDSQRGYAAMLKGHKAGRTFSPSGSVNSGTDRITLGSGHGLQAGEAVVYRSNGGTPIGGLVDGKTYYVIKPSNSSDQIQLAATRSDAMAGRAINLTSVAGSGHSLTPLVSSGTTQASSSAANGAGPGRVTSAAGSGTQSGTTAFIGTGATVDAGDDVNVRADESIQFKVLVGSLSAGGGAVGASISLVTIGTKSEAFIDDNATVRSGTSSNGDINVSALFTDNIDSRSYAGSATALAGVGAQVLIVNDHSSQFAFIDSGANINRAGGTVTVLADADRTINAQAIGGNISGGVAGGAAIVLTDVDGQTTADIRNANVGQQSGQTVRNLTVQADASNTVNTQAIGVNAGLLAGVTGAIAESRIESSVNASIGAGSDITLTGDLNLNGVSFGSADADAIGAAAALGGAAGASFATAVVTPSVTTTIASGAVINAANVNARALHNVTVAGGIQNVGADAKAINASVALIAGASGAVATATSSPVVDASVSGATINTTGSQKLIAHSTTRAKGETTGVGAGLGAGFGVGIVNSTAGGSTRARLVSADLNAGTDIEVRGEIFGDVDAEAQAVGGGLGAGFAESRASAIMNPVIDVTITGSSDLDGRDIIVTARSEGDTFAKVKGVSAALGGARGRTKAYSQLTPDVEAGIGSGSVLDATRTLTISSLHNFTTANQPVNKKAQADGQVAGGAIVGDVGTDVDAIAAAKVLAHVDAGATLRSTGGVVSLIGRSNNSADADASGSVGGFLGLGHVNVDAVAGNRFSDTTNQSSTRTRMDGAVLSGTGLNVQTRSIHVADADGSSSSGGLAAAATNAVNATASPVIETRIGNGVSAANVNIAGTVTTTSDTITAADAFGTGRAGGLLGAGIVTASANMLPTVSNAIGNGSSVSSSQGSISMATNHNTGFQEARAEVDAASGGAVGVVGTLASANALATVSTTAGSGATLNAAGDVSLNTQAQNRASSDASGQTGGIAALGGARAIANGNGSTSTALNGVAGVTAANVSLTAVGTSQSSAVSTASSGGVVNLTGSEATTQSAPAVSATTSGPITAAGSVSIIAAASGGTSVTANGKGGGLIDLPGPSKATGSWAPAVNSVIQAGTVTAGDDVTLAAYNNYDTNGNLQSGNVVRGFASTSGGGLVGVRGTEVNLTSDATVNARMAPGATINVVDDLNVIAKSRNNIDGDAMGKVGGLVAKGSTVVNATMFNQTRAKTDDGSSGSRVRINGGSDLLFQAETNDFADVNVQGGAGGCSARDRPKRRSISSARQRKRPWEISRS